MPTRNGTPDEQAVMMRAIGDSIRDQIAEALGHLPDQSQVINVAAREIELPTPRLTIPPSQIHIPPAQITNEVHSPDVNVTNEVAAPIVNVRNEMVAPNVSVTNDVAAPIVNVTNAVAVPTVTNVVSMDPVAQAIFAMSKLLTPVLDRLSQLIERMTEAQEQREFDSATPPRPRKIRITHADGTSSTLTQE